MNIAIIGYGKMGKIIERIAKERGHEVVLKIGSSNHKDFTKPDPSLVVDVAIDFSTPDSGFDNVIQCLNNGWRVVSGTTGWLDRLETATSFATDQRLAMIYASNYSLGVNIFFAVNQRLARLMNGYEQYEVDVHEVHHTSKKDAPSGTAISIASQIVEEVSRLSTWTHESKVEKDNLPITSERIDPAPGTHIVTYESDIDKIEITHTAKSRDGFALGAVIAAEYIQDRQGIFTMQDVLGID